MLRSEASDVRNVRLGIYSDHPGEENWFENTKIIITEYNSAHVFKPKKKFSGSDSRMDFLLLGE